MALRLASLEGSITAILADLGRLDWLIAVGKHDHRVLEEADRAAIAGLPRLPCTWAVTRADLEPLEPDLVLASIPVREKSLAELLQSYLDMLVLMPTDLASIYRNIRILGNLAAAQERGEALIARMRRSFDELAQRVASQPRKRVYVEVWPRPYMNGPIWVAELVEMLNADFVPQPAGRKKIDEAEILEADPEVIVVTWPGVDDPPLDRIYGRENWQQVTAIRQRRVRAIPEIWVNSPGSNLIRGAEALARAIHDL